MGSLNRDIETTAPRKLARLQTSSTPQLDLDPSTSPRVPSGWSVNEFGVGDVGAVAAEAFEDFVGGLVPDERFRVLVRHLDSVAYVFRERVHGVLGGALQFLGGER